MVIVIIMAIYAFYFTTNYLRNSLVTVICDHTVLRAYCPP